MIRKKYLSKDKQYPGIIRKMDLNPEPKISMINYNSDTVSKVYLKISDIKDLVLQPDYNYWIHCNSTDNNILLETIRDKFNVHPLLLENIQNIDQRPRLNDTEEFNFVVLKNYIFSGDDLIKNNVGIIIFSNLIISFSEVDPFNDIETRLLKGTGKIRFKTCDYLLFSLLDIISDEYYSILDILDQKTISLEKTLLDKDSKLDINNYLKLKNQNNNFRRDINPIHSILEGLINSNSPKINNDNIIYFKDLLSGSIQLIDIINSMSSSIDNVLNLSINVSGYKMNGIMKVLTIISTIFIPLTFIAGIYGMNFIFMPELKYKWGYPVVIGVMLIIVILMIRFFKKKRWF